MQEHRADAARSADDADVYVYRDTDGQPDEPAVAPGQEASDYWYDLSAADSAPVREEARGPFEPLISSSDAAPAARPGGSAADLAGSAAEPAGSRGRHAAPDGPGRRDGPQDAAYAQARRLEQIKDLYATAEAIGERNVDKHFDQLLAQQRELISEYFKQPNTAVPADGGRAEAGYQGESLAPQAGPEPAPSASGSGEEPRAW